LLKEEPKKNHKLMNSIKSLFDPAFPPYQTIFRDSVVSKIPVLKVLYLIGLRT